MHCAVLRAQAGANGGSRERASTPGGGGARLAPQVSMQDVGALVFLKSGGSGALFQDAPEPSHGRERRPITPLGE